MRNDLNLSARSKDLAEKGCMTARSLLMFGTKAPCHAHIRVLLTNTFKAFKCLCIDITGLSTHLNHFGKYQQRIANCQQSLNVRLGLDIDAFLVILKLLL